ncbi:hypothetical protein CAP40_04575 [Sphingomonas sp. IBVSS2]|uniref:DMP19 family protein n=1 Tax=Sphingomonas sp. IBVSS2 TaxID=1985172 RepID=UPI000A2E5DB0|nr:hypothetical protein [Sphingomonas sp. IBVSS2]OSZ70107.1 hypothetical protein CAP40_04575 [Sphingomonas sp. IBVSS2]
MWKSRVLKPSASIDKVIVSEAMGDPPYGGLPGAVQAFVMQALSAEYVPGELPREALIASHTLAYEAEVYNGGHVSGFLGNLGIDNARWDLIAEGLDRVGLPGSAAIFADFRAFARKHPLRFRSWKREYPQYDPFFEELDSRVSAEPQYCIVLALHAWLEDKPWIEQIPDSDYRALNVARCLVPPHPLQQQRRDLRAPRVEADMRALRKALLKGRGKQRG